MDDDELLDALATAVARNEIALVGLRPPEVNPSVIQGEDVPVDPLPPFVPPPEEETHFLELELLSEDDPPEPIAFAKYVVELPNGSVVEGYLNAEGKARLDGIPPGECKVTFPEYAEPEDEGEAPEEEKEPAPEPGPEPSEECRIGKVLVECEHAGKRKKKVTLPDTEHAGNVLEVVGAAKGSGDKIKTSLTLSGARCGNHTGKALEVKTPTGQTVLLAEDTSTFEAYFDDPTEMSIVRMWPWGESPDVYKLHPQGCGGLAGKEVLVRVFPGYEPSLTFTFALDTADRVAAKMEQSRAKGRVETRGRPAQTAWGLTFEAKLKYGKRVESISAKYESKLRQMASVNLAVKRSIDWFCQIFYDWVGVSVTPEFPSLQVAYEGKFKEIDDSLRVGPEYSLTLKADPLFGLTFKLDVLDVIIKALGNTQLRPVATFLAKVRGWAKENGQTLELELSFSGLIGGEVGAEKKADKQRANFKGKIEGKLKVGFKAKAEASAKFLISFAFGAEVSGDTGVAAKLLMDQDDKGLYLKGALTLLECKFKWSAWASGKFIWEVKESYEDEYTLWEEKDLWESRNAYVMTK